jgi:hypothetical protein
MLHAGVIYEIPGSKIIRAVDDKISSLDKSFYIRAVDIGNNRLHFDARVDPSNMIGASDGFRNACLGISFGKERLPLQVCWLDKVSVYYSDVANTGAGKHFGLRCAEGARADYDDP